MNGNNPADYRPMSGAAEIDLMRISGILEQIDRLKREWSTLPEDVRRAYPDLAEFFARIATRH